MSLVKAAPADLRAGIHVASVYARAGIEFVVVPALSNEHRQELIEQSVNALEALEKQAED